jgi:hypothetical protein
MISHDQLSSERMKADKSTTQVSNRSFDLMTSRKTEKDRDRQRLLDSLYL